MTLSMPPESRFNMSPTPLMNEDNGPSTPPGSRRFVADPGRIGEMSAALHRGEFTAEELTTRFVERIEAVEHAVQAFREVDVEGALAQARALDRERTSGAVRGPLHGVPVAVKDVIDAAGLPTRCNSALHQARAPASADARVVADLRAAGAVILGKAHTTEFAFFDPSPARNPHDTDHTPGGSSSGSAAAVAAGMVPAALGTQTVASVNRPAAYCGTAAFKPSSGLLSTFGVTPLAPLFDTIGLFGFRVADAVAVFEAIRPAYAPPPTVGGGAMGGVTVVALRDPLLDDAVPAVSAAMAAAADRLRDDGHRVLEVDSPIDFRGLADAQMRCALYELGRVHRGLLEVPTDRVGEKFRNAIVEGAAIADAEYLTLRTRFTEDRARLFQELDNVVPGGLQAVLWPAAPDTAPRGLAWTGDPRFICPWTALGGPVVTVRVGADPAGLPIGALITAAPGHDASLAIRARRLALALEA